MWAGLLSWRPLGGLVLAPCSWWRLVVLGNMWLAGVSPGTCPCLPSGLPPLLQRGPGCTGWGPPVTSSGFARLQTLLPHESTFTGSEDWDLSRPFWETQFNPL